MTLNNIDDGSQLEDLVEQVEADITDVCLDGAYDHASCWNDLIDRNINPIIPPRDNAVEWDLDEVADFPEYPRNLAIRRIDEIGKKNGSKKLGIINEACPRRHRYKSIHGNKLYSRILAKQKVENSIKIKVINIMTAQGMPVSKPTNA